MAEPNNSDTVALSSEPPQVRLTVPLEPDTKSETGKRTRSASPAKLPAELALKAQTQKGRLELLIEIADGLPADGTISLGELMEMDSQIEEIHRLFLEEHRFMESAWPTAHLEHPYFRDATHHRCCRAYSKFKRAAATIKDELAPRAHDRSAHSDDSRDGTRLPNIKLPKFSGAYAEWPSFSDLFNSLITSRSALSDVERLHYLRGCLEGTPAHLIASFPLTGASFAPSWQTLVDRYENKRLHIQSHLDSISNIAPMTAKSVKALNEIITTVTEAHTALRTLSEGQDMWGCMLVHQVSRNLDRSTKEAWETSLGSSQDYPTFDKLIDFLTARARALERVESTSVAHGTAQQGPLRRTAHAAVSSAVNSGLQNTGTSSNDRAYGCDCCKGDHYVVSCARFRALDARARRQLAVDKRLCFNCLGRHNVRSCRATQGCKECREKHHTMLHGSFAQQRDRTTGTSAAAISTEAAQ